jgi:hypothetical protein
MVGVVKEVVANCSEARDRGGKDELLLDPIELQRFPYKSFKRTTT